MRILLILLGLSLLFLSAPGCVHTGVDVEAKGKLHWPFHRHHHKHKHKQHKAHHDHKDHDEDHDDHDHHDEDDDL